MGFSTLLHSQEIVDATVNNIKSVFQTKKRDFSGEKYGGSPYFNDNFETGTPYIKNEQQPKFPMRFNAYSDEIEMMPSGNEEVYNMIKKGYIKAEIGGKVYSLHFFLDKNNNEKEGYLIELSQPGKVQLFFKPIKILTKAKEPSSSYETYFPPSYVDQSEFYIITDKHPTAKIFNLKKKDILNLLNDKSTEIELFVKKNKLNYKNEADVTKTFNYYNSL
ncbi:MAG: hypothetical protein CO119_11120 [Flavobacteriales bacterium CG_4_9_14_3_um_filter_40_17]|nr:MAG: hypothetical protein CO119_11120 [Flavobacteriales bacterium CG_4_9_14_3_um_filter_40_17]